MKVVILNTADAHGGAAIASWRLLHALAGEGVDARMLVVDRTTADPLVDVAGTAEQRRWAFLRERIGIFAANGLNRRDLFKVSTARYGVGVSQLDKPGDAVAHRRWATCRNGKAVGVDAARYVVHDGNLPPCLWLRWL